MTREVLNQFVADTIMTFRHLVMEPATYLQLGIVAAVYILARFLAARLRRLFPALTSPPAGNGAHPLSRAAPRSNRLIVPLLAIALLRISVDVSYGVLGRSWVVQIALSVAVLLLFYSWVRESVKSRVVATTLLWLAIPLLALQFVGLLGRLIAILESIALNVGNIHVSLYGLIRVVLSDRCCSGWGAFPTTPARTSSVASSSWNCAPAKSPRSSSMSRSSRWCSCCCCR